MQEKKKGEILEGSFARPVRRNKALGNVTKILFVVAIILVLSISLFIGYEIGLQNVQTTTQSVTEVSTQTVFAVPSTQTITTTASLLVFNSSSYTFPVNCCLTLPDAFLLGNYSFSTLLYAPPPGTTRNGTVITQAGGVLLIIEISSGQTTENVSFSWAGTFSETLPFPNNATAFYGAVRLVWFTNGTSAQAQDLYLGIYTGNSQILSNAEDCTVAEYTIAHLAMIHNETSTTITNFTSTTFAHTTSFYTTANYSTSVGYASSTTTSPLTQTGEFYWTVTACQFVSP